MNINTLIKSLLIAGCVSFANAGEVLYKANIEELKSGEEFIVPTQYTEIYQQAFEGVEGINKIVVPSNVELDHMAFALSNAKEIEIQDSLRLIGKDKRYLKTNWGSDLFFGCKNLEKISMKNVEGLFEIESKLSKSDVRKTIFGHIEHHTAGNIYPELYDLDTKVTYKYLATADAPHETTDSVKFFTLDENGNLQKVD